MNTLFAALVFVGASAFAAEPLDGPKVDSLEGIYSVIGTDAESTYTGSAIIRKRGDGYAIQVTSAINNEDGEPKGFGSTIGVGLRTDDILSVSWLSDNKTTVGLTVYKIGKAGVLDGKWIAFPGGKDARTETLKRVAPLPKAAKAETSHENFIVHRDREPLHAENTMPRYPNLAGKWGQYTIRQSGPAFMLDGANGWTAIGWIDGDCITLSWRHCNMPPAFGFYKLRDDGALDGKWNYLTAWDFGDPVSWFEETIHRTTPAHD